MIFLHVFSRLTIVTVLGLALVSPAVAQDNTLKMEQILPLYKSAPHADQSSEAFNHWNNDGEIPPACAACHSRGGFLDLIGADGSPAGTVDKPAPLGTTVDCMTCHDPAVGQLAQITFPSGAAIDHPGASAPCMVCHQGRASGKTVTDAVSGAAAEDAVVPDLRFINVHYRAAAASMLGSVAGGGFEYPGQSYAGQFAHVADLATCTGCHDPHSTAVKVALCAACHKDQELPAIRTSTVDRDGDGDMAEGAAAEISALRDALGDALRLYASGVAGQGVLYARQYPYFFNDKNGNGAADADELAFANAYSHWTPRMLKAAYNYQFVTLDPGIHAHNPAYAAQLLIDSIQDLAGAVDGVATGFNRP